MAEEIKDYQVPKAVVHYKEKFKVEFKRVACRRRACSVETLLTGSHAPLSNIRFIGLNSLQSEIEENVR